MKTSIKLLILLAVITLTSMVSIDLLLKQQYDLIDWSNPYHTFKRQALPTLRHVRIVGTPEYEVLIQPGATSQALLSPELKSSVLRITQQGDTLLITFTEKGKGWCDQRNPIQWADGSGAATPTTQQPEGRERSG